MHSKNNIFGGFDLSYFPEIPTSHRTIITLVHEDTLMEHEKTLIKTQLEWLCNAQLINLVDNIIIETQ